MIRTEDIYRAAFDSDHLEILPTLLAAACGARSSIVSWFHPDGSPELLNYSHFPVEEMSAYIDNFTEHDLWTKVAFDPKRMNTVVVADPVVGSKTFEKSIIYNELFRKFDDDTFHCMGGACQNEWGAGLIGFHKGRVAGPFEEASQITLERIMPHVRTALAVRGQLAGQAKALRTADEAFNALATAVIVVRRDGRVLRCNAAAEVIIKSVGALKLIQGRLVTRDGELEASIARATSMRGPSATAIALGEIGRSRLLITVVPLGPGEAALLFRGIISNGQSSQALLTAVFGLTAAEASVAVSLANGSVTGELAVSRNVSINTLKSQRKAVLAKMECRNQVELAAMLARLMQWCENITM